MRQALIAAIRTGIQAVIAALVAWLVGQGIDVPAEWAEATILLLLGIVVFLLNKAGEKWPWINQLLSLGLSPSTPTYEAKKAA